MDDDRYLVIHKPKTAFDNCLIVGASSIQNARERAADRLGLTDQERDEELTAWPVPQLEDGWTYR